MRSRSRYLIFIVMVLALLLSACGPDADMDLEEILDPEGDGLREEQSQQFAGEGSADVYYHYHSTHQDLNFKIDMPFAISFAETDQPGSFDAQGIYQDLVSFTMAASGGPTGRCTVNCTVNLKFVAEGKIELGEEGECQIPVNFSFVPQGDFLLDGDCPQEFMDVVDCNGLSMVLLDPGIYTFIPGDTELYLPSGEGVTREAEIKNLILPEAAKGTCKW